MEQPRIGFADGSELALEGEVPVVRRPLPDMFETDMFQVPPTLIEPTGPVPLSSPPQAATATRVRAVSQRRHMSRSFLAQSFCQGCPTTDEGGRPHHW